MALELCEGDGLRLFCADGCRGGFDIIVDVDLFIEDGACRCVDFVFVAVPSGGEFDFIDAVIQFTDHTVIRLCAALELCEGNGLRLFCADGCRGGFRFDNDGIFRKSARLFRFTDAGCQFLLISRFGIDGLAFQLQNQMLCAAEEIRMI